MIFNINQEWKFITNMIHGRPTDKICLKKKENLFLMQVLLGKISSALNRKEKSIIKGAYLRLKDTIKIKLSEKYDINGHIVWEK